MSPRAFQIVGRDDLVALTRAVVRGAGTAPPAVLLVGEAGIGKTALLHFAVRAADDQLCVVFAAGVAGESHGYAALAGLLWPVLPSAATLPHALRDALTDAMHGPQATARPALVRDAVIAVLEAAAVERPVLLVIDDVDLFNDEMRDLLVGVAAQLITTRVRAVLTARRRDVLAGVGRAIRTVEIGPLSPRDSALLVDGQPDQPDPSVRGEIIRWSRGNPLALIEFTRAYARNGTTTFHGATLSGAAGTHPLFADRIAALPADTRRLLMFAAAGTGRESVDAITAAAGPGGD
ncbi:MAG: AAA family ATPase, partial [Mycolicibacterium sp.]|nr:AAA family ATPase [Mycolicibacterium sp.]